MTESDQHHAARARRRWHGPAVIALAVGILAVFAVAVVGPTADRAAADPVVVQSGQSNVSNMNGPTTFSASFSRPTTAGDLLAVSVVCGVIIGGMTAPTVSLPAGWHKGVGLVGGILGGLEADVYYYPDNPGGITTFGAGSVPSGTEAYCTTFWAELSGLGSSVSVDSSGVGSANSGSSITARTAAAVPAGDLVLLSSTDGTEVPDNAYTLPPGFSFLAQQNAGHVDQPGTFADLTATGDTTQGGTISWDGGSNDSVAVVVALSTSPSTTTTTTTTPVGTGLAVTTSSLPGAVTAESYSAPLSAAGGNPPYEWRVVANSGRLPRGLRLHEHTGVISGRLSRGATSSTFTVEVLDTRVRAAHHTSARAVATRTLSIAVS